MAPTPVPDPNAPSPSRARVGELKQLLARLFADPPPPDLITIDDILRRYQLTGFGAPAMAAIEQTQRLIRNRRDYGQIGLCEFHIGLIFLHFNDPRAAATQFVAARQAWTLAGDPAATALSHYAQAVALRLAFHYEPAMSHFSRAEKTLRRSAIGAQAKRLAELGAVLEPILREEQDALRESMWPVDTGPVDTGPVDTGPVDTGPVDTGPVDTGPVDIRPVHTGAVDAGPIDTGPIDTGRVGMGSVDRPASGAAGGPTRRARGEATGDNDQPTGGAVPGPISRLPRPATAAPAPAAARPIPSDQTDDPIPGHRPYDDRYQWYTVHKRKDAYLPDFVEGTMVLVDTNPALVPDGQELVIIAGRHADLGSVIVRPSTPLPDLPYCYLGYRLPLPPGLPPETARALHNDMPLVLDEEGRSISMNDAVFLGVVVGAWHKIMS